MHCNKTKTKNGQIRWVCVEDGPRDPATGKRQQIKRRAKTQKEAKKRVEQVIRSLEEEGIDERLNKKITFEQVASKWLETYKATGVTRGSYRLRERDSVIMGEYFAKTPIANVTPFMYQNMLNDLHKRGYAFNTMNKLNTSGGMIFKYAKKNKLIQDNPNEDAVVPKKRKTIENVKENQLENKYMESDELDEFLNAVLKFGRNIDKEWFFTLAFSGMRPGELLSLKKQDMNFEDNTITINKTLYSETNNMRGYNLVPPKTSSSYRTIEMDSKIMDMLKKLVHENDVHKMKYRRYTDDYHDRDFVFQHENGYPFIHQNLHNHLDRILRHTNVNKKITPHSFRHTHISMLTEAGAELSTIMERVGHSDPDTTLKVYTHVTKKMKERSVKKVTSHHSHLLEKISF